MRQEFDPSALRSEIAGVMRSAAKDYPVLSTLRVWQAPEFWMQVAIANALRDRFYVALEVGTGELCRWHDSGSEKPKSSPESLRSGPVDLVLLNRDPDREEAHTVGLIEVKKYAHRGDCYHDAIRLKALAQHIETVRTACVAVHLQDKSPDTLQQWIEVLFADLCASKGRAAMEKGRAAIEKYRDGDDWCAAVVVDLKGLPL